MTGELGEAENRAARLGGHFSTSKQGTLKRIFLDKITTKHTLFTGTGQIQTYMRQRQRQIRKRPKVEFKRKKERDRGEERWSVPASEGRWGHTLSDSPPTQTPWGEEVAWWAWEGGWVTEGAGQGEAWVPSGEESAPGGEESGEGWALWGEEG